MQTMFFMQWYYKVPFWEPIPFEIVNASPGFHPFLEWFVRSVTSVNDLMMSDGSLTDCVKPCQKQGGPVLRAFLSEIYYYSIIKGLLIVRECLEVDNRTWPWKSRKIVSHWIHNNKIHKNFAMRQMNKPWRWKKIVHPKRVLSMDRPWGAFPLTQGTKPPKLWPQKGAFCHFMSIESREGVW